MWCQGTVDSAIGVGIMVSMAKYFKELEEDGIRPEYNMKFIAFGGEEYGLIGALHYEITHQLEPIFLVIDLNQIGYNQTYPPSTLNVATNRIELLPVLELIVNRSNYVHNMGNNSSLSFIWTPMGSMSDEFVFSVARWVRPIKHCELTTVMFLKDFGWYRHHRDGVNHTEGDVMKYVDWNEVNLNAGMILNVTYGLMFKQVTWDPIGFIPFVITIVIIMISVIMLWKNEYFMDLLKKK
ncbi:MAG: M28 family metallopeptidase, partial [Candidatus Thermoplasmatota archaeon]|nr:M28 family metallopeptidase [Candidatus Thermoplasmatota archaeon]